MRSHRKLDVLQQPSISLPSNADQDQTYIVFMIDQDVPRNGTSFTILHWFAPNLHRTPDNDTLAVTMIEDNTPSIAGVNYFPPNPPPASGPHRYTWLLYAQPPNFTLPEGYAGLNAGAEPSPAALVGFNLTAFAAAADLGPALAANYMRVLNGTEAETSSAESATGTSGVAPTESPTFTASITDSSAAASAISASTATETGEASSTTTASTTGETGDAASASTDSTASATGPAETSSEGGAASLLYGAGGARELLMGLALAVVGAGAVLA
jgi:hypothetical protein